jgi:type VI secretion system protein ImpK
MTNSAPSLLDNTAAMSASPLNNETAMGSAHTLMDLMYDGFYALFLLKNGNAPKDEANFARKLQQFLNTVDDNARKLQIPVEDVHAAKYAFCAAVDETVLRSGFAIRESWSRHPLQLVLFGEQLAGENFFQRLDELRSKGNPRLQALEVFHMCLLLGFQGRYLLESPEKLHYLTARLGEEIAHIKGKPAVFAPHWDRPDQIVNKLRTETPLWVIAAVFSVVALGTFSGIDKLLTHHTLTSIAAYNDIIRMAPHAATLILTLP